MTAIPLDETHDARRRSWVPAANAHPEFPIQNLPLGVFSAAGSAPRGGIAIGDSILDLKAALDAGLFAGEAEKRGRRCGRSDAEPVDGARRAAAHGAAQARVRAARRRRPRAGQGGEACNEDPASGGGVHAARARGHRRLHRFLRGHPSRVQRRRAQRSPAAAPAQLQARAGGVSQPGVVRGCLGHRAQTARRPARGAGKGNAGVRAVAQARYRAGTGRLDRARERARRADPDRARGRAPRRALHAERLVGARHAALGVGAARAVPCQELRHYRFALGRHDGCARAVSPGAAAAPGRRSAAAAVPVGRSGPDGRRVQHRDRGARI